MSRNQEIIAILGLLVGICACIAGWLAIPQTQKIVEQISQSKEPLLATPFSLTASNTVQPLPTIANSITGQVLWNDKPLEGISILLFQEICSENPIAQTTSDSLGSYRFVKLTPGRYAIGVNLVVSGKEISWRGTPLFYGTCLQGNDLELGKGKSAGRNIALKKADLVVQSPANGSTINSTPTFSWEKYPNAAYYILEIYRMTGNSGTTAQTIRTVHTSLVSSQALEVGTKYNATVMTFNINGTEIAEAYLYDLYVATR